MIKRIVITDLTRMYHGNVCIAGIDKEHNQVRPVLPKKGIREEWCQQDGKPIIFPFSLVEFEFFDPKPQPPHTEDTEFAENSIKFCEDVRNRANKVLEWSRFNTVEEVFEQPILREPGFYVKDCTGPRSLGTIIPKSILDVKYAQDRNQAWDFRLKFEDNSSTEYRIKITDLTFQYYCRSLLSELKDHHEVAERITNYLTSHETYLRIGLARGWNEFPDRCYLQINGIYTFPDMYEGKTFFDFR